MAKLIFQGNKYYFALGPLSMDYQSGSRYLFSIPQMSYILTAADSAIETGTQAGHDMPSGK